MRGRRKRQRRGTASRRLSGLPNRSPADMALKIDWPGLAIPVGAGPAAGVAAGVLTVGGRIVPALAGAAAAAVAATGAEWWGAESRKREFTEAMARALESAARGERPAPGSNGIPSGLSSALDRI